MQSSRAIAGRLVMWGCCCVNWACISLGDLLASALYFPCFRNHKVAFFLYSLLKKFLAASFIQLLVQLPTVALHNIYYNMLAICQDIHHHKKSKGEKIFMKIGKKEFYWHVKKHV